MPIQLSELRQVTLPGPKDLRLPPAGVVAVLVRLHPGKELPDYAQLRADFGHSIVSADVDVTNIDQLRSDPDVIAVALSRRVYAA